jgi:hypothetical protein
MTFLKQRNTKNFFKRCQKLLLKVNTQNINQYQVIFIQHHPYLPGHMCVPCYYLSDYGLLASAVLRLALREIPVHFMLHADTSCSMTGELQERTREHTIRHKMKARAQVIQLGGV